MSFQHTPFFYPTNPPKLSLDGLPQIPHDANSPTAHLIQAGNPSLNALDSVSFAFVHTLIS